MLLPFVVRELREQFAGSRLGIAWTLLQPLLLVLLYWWVFARVLRMRVPAPPGAPDTPFIVFLLSGLLPWLAFSEGLMRGAGAVVARREVVTNMAFPFHLFPLAAVLAVHCSHLAAFALFLVVYYGVTGLPSTAQVLGVLLLLGCQLALAAGLALMLSALVVYLRDLLHLLPLLLQVVFYTAPILYPMSLVPEEFHSILMLNPYSGFAQAFHRAILEGQWPALPLLLWLLALAALSMGLGTWMFKRLRPGFADVL